LDSFAFGAAPAAVLPVFQEGNTFRAARISSVKNIPDSVFVEHILLDGRDKAVAQAKADSLIKLLDGGASFTELAAANSLDKNPNVAPGELGWMTQNYMIPGFDTCFVAAPNKLMKLETQYGLHIVKIKEKTSPVKKVQLAILEKSAVAGKETFQKYYSQANDVASKSAGKLDKFRAVIKEMNLVPIPAMGIEEGAKTVATYKNARELSKWVYEAKKDEVSQIISIDNKYFFVATVTAIREEGIPSLASMESTITTILKREKSNEKMLAKVKEDVKGMANIEEIAAKLGTTVNKQSGISFGAMGSQSFDPIFIGSVAGAKENTLTGPVKGNVGIYIFNVDARQTGAFFTENDAKAKAIQMFSYQLQLLQGVFEKSGEVKDHRARFF
jgi:peptidyl-prolyl cis-trans isomerase D